jgi:hypothetical protein
MPPVGVQPAILVSERPQTHALDCTATGIGKDKLYQWKSRAFDELEQIWDTFVTVSLSFLRKTVESVSSRLQKSGQNAGAYVVIWH